MVFLLYLSVGIILFAIALPTSTFLLQESNQDLVSEIDHHSKKIYTIELLISSNNSLTRIQNIDYDDVWYSSDACKRRLFIVKLCYTK